MCFLGQHGSELRFNVDDAEIGKALIHATCQDAVVCVKSSQQVTGGTVDAADQADVLRDDDVAVTQAADENFTSIAKVCRTLQNGPEHSICALWLVGEEVIVKAADRDLHSGHFGGAAANPIHILSGILAGLHDETGRVTLDGFYEGVEETPSQIKAAWDKLASMTTIDEAKPFSS